MYPLCLIKIHRSIYMELHVKQFDDLRKRKWRRSEIWCVLKPSYFLALGYLFLSNNYSNTNFIYMYKIKNNFQGIAIQSYLQVLKKMSHISHIVNLSLIS